VFGGHILALVDRVAARRAIRHATASAVTVSVDRWTPRAIHVGELVTAKARRELRGPHSGGRRESAAENVLTGDVRHTNSCYVTYVGADENGVRRKSHGSVPETPDEKRVRSCGKRRANRVMERRTTRVGVSKCYGPGRVAEQRHLLMRAPSGR